MPIVAKTLQQSFCRSSSTQLQKQQDRVFANNSKHLKRQDLVIKSEEEELHVPEEEIKPKHLIKERTVAAGETKEVKPEQDIKDQRQSQDSKEIIQKKVDHSYLKEQEISNFKDYQIYQNGNINEFLADNTLETAKTVADICLVHDHFILVKMPEDNLGLYGQKLNESAKSSINLRNLKSRTKYQKENRKLCCCLRNKRNRITKIAPIHEEPEDLSDNQTDDKSNSNCLKITSCWQVKEQEVEMYQTKTKIYKNFPNTIDNRSKSLKQSRLAQSQRLEESQRLDFKQSSDIPTISGSLLKSSLQYKVALQPYGSLLDSQNNNENTLNQLDMMKRTRHRKCPCLSSFYWLFKPFRSKCYKTEPKIQAIVYKTYFVKWTKPPDTLTHGYGVKSLRPASVLRRCRSALF